jgi:hypothetical protein
MQDVVLITVTPTESSKVIRTQSDEQARNDRMQQKALDKADEVCAFIQSVINDHPEGVIIRRGSNPPKNPPAEWTSFHRLEWADIYEHVPGSNKGEIRRAVSSAIFQRFAPDAANNCWVRLT